MRRTRSTDYISAPSRRDAPPLPTALDPLVTLIPDRDGGPALRVLRLDRGSDVVPRPRCCLRPQARVPPRLGFRFNSGETKSTA
jgi:hypothetical protein